MLRRIFDSIERRNLRRIEGFAADTGWREPFVGDDATAERTRRKKKTKLRWSAERSKRKKIRVDPNFQFIYFD